MIENENNYNSTTALTPETIDTAAGVDLDIIWEDLTVDMQCHEMDPAADIAKVGLLRFQEADYEANTALLASGELEMEALAGYIDFNTGGTITQCQLSDLTNFGTPVDLEEEYKEDPTKAYMLTFGSNTEPGVGTRTMVFVRPTADSLNTTVRVGNACDPETGMGILEFEAELAEPLAMPAGKTTIAWNNVTEDGLNNTFARNKVDRVLLGYFNDTPEDLVADIFNLEANAEDLWEMRFTTAGARSVDLTNAYHLDAAGNPEDSFFEGFDSRDPGTWLFALLCTTCQNPSPMVLTVLEPG